MLVWKRDVYRMACRTCVVLLVLAGGVGSANGVEGGRSNTEKEPLFNACVRNNSGKRLFYYRKWCSTPGQCEDFKLIGIGANEEFEHSSRNSATIVFRYQSGGAYGKWLEFSMAGEQAPCGEDSTAVFELNDRGYVRLVPVPARIQELSLAGGDVRKRPANSINAAESNARIFEAIEIDILQQLNQTGVPLIVPPPVRNSATADFTLSMNLGIAVADAIGAVVMRDQEQFNQYAKIIYEYGETLDVGDPILSQYTRISQEVADGNWLNVEHILYRLKDEITAELFREEMQDNATLAMAAGWLEGLYLAARSLVQEFHEEAGELLRDRDFVRYLDDQLQKVTPEMRQNKEYQALLAVLPRIDRVLNKPEAYRYRLADLQEIIAIYEPLRRKVISQ